MVNLIDFKDSEMLVCKINYKRKKFQTAAKDIILVLYLKYIFHAHLQYY